MFTGYSVAVSGYHGKLRCLVFPELHLSQADQIQKFGIRRGRRNVDAPVSQSTTATVAYRPAHGDLGTDNAAVLRQAMTTVCDEPSASLEQIAAGIAGSTAIAEEPIEVRGTAIGAIR